MDFIRKKLGGLSTAYSIRPLIFCLIFGLAACLPFGELPR